MAYTVKLLTRAVQRLLPVHFSYATVASSTYTLFNAEGTTLGVVSLTAETLNDTIPSADVLIDNGLGAGHYQIGTVMSDGSNSNAGGTVIASSSPAAVPISDNFNLSSLPPLGSKLDLVGSSGSGGQWFSTQSPALPEMVVCGSATTAGAISTGTIAVVSISGTWTLIQL